MSIYGIIDLLLQGIIGSDRAGCADGRGFSDAPLPCARGIWQASTVKSWILEYERYLLERQNDGILLTKHLVHCQTSVTFVSSDGNDLMPDLIHWCKGMDSLGSLIWTVYPLQQLRMQNDEQYVWE